MRSPAMLKVAYVGLGPLGRRIVSDLVRRQLGRVVAAVDPHPSLVGRSLSELVHGADAGIRVVSSIEEVSNWHEIRCAIVTTSSALASCMETFRALLVRGLSIVSTCEELVWPWLRNQVLAQELNELALRYGSRLLGTGINPGFLMDTLPVAASMLCHSVRSVTIERVQDAATRRVPFQKKIGVGLDEAEFRRRMAEGTLRHVGLGESLHFVAHYLGMRIERWTESIMPLLTDTRLESALGAVLPGRVRGVRQVARGWTQGRQALELVFHAAIGEREPFERIVIDGEPPLQLLMPGGVHGDTATSAVVLNSIRALATSSPGLHTMASVPLQGCASPDEVGGR